MGLPRPGFGSTLLILGLILVLMPTKVAAFGAGNIPSIAQVEGHNWRHGDIEDMLKTIAFLHGKKWTTLLVQRTYFGNWLRDYSQAVDVGSLKGVNAETIRILVWVLSFLANGYATEEFEVTAERLGVYRPEEHIDNPLGYADNKDAREFDPRLRGLVMPEETQIDPHTGMKNYIANDRGNWATSTGYLKFSFERCIHFGRLYTSGSHGRGNEDDLCEALRCLGQALHCMEDFSAHSNYCELALRELGYHNVFAHCGSATEINLHGRRVFPLVTGTFGGVDFLHSVLGEANDHFTQSEVDQLDIALKNVENSSGPSSGGGGTRGLGSSLFGGGGSGASDFISLVASLPGIGGGMASEARDLKRMAQEQESRNVRSGTYSGTRSNANVVPGMSEDFDPVKVSKQVYPILAFRDKIVKSINRGIAKIPGLESLLEKIGETLTAFVLGLLAPFIRPIIAAVTKALKEGSSGVISASAHSQLEPWTNPHCSDPTHSMLSKDHFTNILNPCAGRIATTILQYVVPRILYAWENPGVPVQEVINDVCRAFHHPAARDERIEIHKTMFDTVRQWANEHPRRHDLDRILGSESVRNGKNHIQQTGEKGGSRGHSHGGGIFDGGILEQLGHGRPKGSLWDQCTTRDMEAMGASSSARPGSSGRPTSNYSERPGSGYGGAPPSHYQSGAGYPGHQNPRPQGEAASYYTGVDQAPGPSHQPPPYPPGPGYGPSHGHAHGYQNQGYSGPPPPQQGGYPPYGHQQQQWGGGYGNPPYPY
ncbi:heterokaryon incompatibility Het-C [Xylaria bambusicola]|uniref:heterokaryon incompatibility Het-C n=1 Tax=Xylaria bambusicola TaxID=326684 RepID=UPI002007283B|nr:heterokaryon incompatibility Het-C [Xylaria bambusicola]KAI0517257.1 heterokaryon incompatibility Het-C [Xylaria bambusicola]